MKKLLLGLLGLTAVTVVGLGSYNNGANDMKELQEQYGMRYNVIEASNTVFLIEYDDVAFAMENNKMLGEVVGYAETQDGIQIDFVDGTGYWIEK